MTHGFTMIDRYIGFLGITICRPRPARRLDCGTPSRSSSRRRSTLEHCLQSLLDSAPDGLRRRRMPHRRDTQRLGRARGARRLRRAAIFATPRPRNARLRARSTPGRYTGHHSPFIWSLPSARAHNTAARRRAQAPDGGDARRLILPRNAGAART